MSRPSGALACALALAGTGVQPGVVTAAAPLGDSPDAPRIEEIIVTALRREAPAQSVPVALTALLAPELVREQIREVDNLQYVAPNLEIAPAQGNRLTANIAMRGQAETDIVPTSDPAVGLFIDGAYIGRSTGANLRLVDIERVEILRGPQGTLFGRNTIGGAINIVPYTPANDFAVYGEVLAGNYDALTLTGIINAPLPGGSAAVRVAAQHAEHSGYAHTVVLDEDLGDDNTDFVRAQLRWSPAERWDLNLAFDVSDVSTGNQWITLLAADPPATLLPDAAGNPEDSLDNYQDPYTRTTYASHAGNFKSTLYGTAATLTFTRDGATLRAIGAYRKLDLDIDYTDMDGTPYDIVTQLQQKQRQEQGSVELQAYGDGFGERLDWITGVHLFDEDADVDALSSSLAPLSGVENNNRGEVHNESWSAYAQLGYRLTSRWRVSGGLRYTEDTRQLTSRNARRLGGEEICSVAPEILDGPDLCRATLPDKTYSYVPFEVSLAYLPSASAMLYAKYSRGYRAGGYNFRMTSSLSALPFDPEQVSTYELGLKSDLAGGHLRLNLALFRSDYDDIQLAQILPAPGQGFAVATVNAGEARIDGGELEVTARVYRARLSVALGVIDARYTKLAPDVIDVDADGKFRLTPDTTASLAVDLPLQARAAEVNFHADYAWRDVVYFGVDERARQPAYGLANARLSLRPGRRNLELSLWARNLADEHYLSRAVATPNNGLIKAIPGDPRTWGAGIAYRFGGINTRR